MAQRNRWRDGVALASSKKDMIHPEDLEQIVTDRTNQLVGRDVQGTYRAIDPGIVRPFLLDIVIPSDLYPTASFNGYGWRNDDGKFLDDFAENPEIGNYVHEQVAARILRNESNAYMRSPPTISVVDNQLRMAFAITPLHVTEKDRDYTPVGAKF